MINRRGFLGSMLAAVAAPFLPTPAVVTPVPPPLMFHPDAFAMVTRPLEPRDLASFTNRMDMLYGYGFVRPYTTVRVMDA